MRALYIIVLLLAAWLGGCSRGSSAGVDVTPGAVVLESPAAELDVGSAARSYPAEPTSTIADAPELAARFAAAGSTLDAMAEAGGERWLVLDVLNATAHEEWVLSFNAQFRVADAWGFSCDASHQSCRPVGEPMRNGFYVPPPERPLASMGYAFPLTIEANERYRVVLRLEVAPREPVKAQLTARHGYLRSDQLLRLLVYLIIGGMFGSSFYAAFIFLWTRDRPYGWYAGYAFLGAGIWVGFYSVSHYWIDGLRENQAVAGVGGMGALVCALGFHDSFLDLGRVAPRIHRLVQMLLVVGLLVLGMVLVAPVAMYKPITAFTGAMGILTLLGAAFYCAARRERRARFILVGWIPFLVSGLVTSASVLGMVPALMGKEVVVICHGFEMLSLSFALADRIKILSEEREAARAEAVHELELRLEAAERARRLEAERAIAVAEADRQRAVAHTDALTGLANRLAFDRDLRRFAGDPVSFHGHAVLVMDVDGLKRLNDSRGHGAGDDMLIAFADQLRDQLELGAQIYRLGGDEFVVVLETEERSGVVFTEAGIREAMSRVRDDGFPEVGISIGVAHSDEGADPIEVVELADRRMYDDKERDGRPRRREDRESIVTITPPPMPDL